MAEMLGKSLGKGGGKGVSSQLGIRALRLESEWTGEHPFHVRTKFGFNLPPVALRGHHWPQVSVPLLPYLYCTVKSVRFASWQGFLSRD